MWFVVVCGGLWWFVEFSATLIISAGFLKWNPGLIHPRYHSMGLDERKPVFEGLRTTQAQTSLRIRAD